MHWPQWPCCFLFLQDFAVEKISRQKRAGRWKLALVIAICAAPLIASYLTYYVIKPDGRNNYGALIDPRAYPLPDLGGRLLDGKAVSLDDYQGRWLMIHADGGDCAETCQQKLFELRQLRTMQGKDMERIERVWLITDDKPLSTVLMREYDGTRMVRVNAAALKAWLPTDAGTQLQDHIYIVDPRGHLMMRFPKNPDPRKVKNDMSKLLRASAIG
jgi:cytochrome oxidase Cu insertion factor (SCO1/SenC/PrrC family)